MSLVFKIAFRNLWRHKGKSLVIGIILFFGALVMTMGNAVINGMDRGIRENLVERFTGHAVIMSTNRLVDDIWSGIPMPKEMPVIGGYPEVRDLLLSDDDIAQILPAAMGLTLILNEESDFAYSFLVGVEFENYQRMFLSNVTAIEGKLLDNGERGLLLTDGARNFIYEQTGWWILPTGGDIIEEHLSDEALSNKATLETPDNLVLMGFSGSGDALDVRTEIKGIVRYNRLNELFKGVSFIDIETFRECFNYLTASDSVTEVEEKTKELLTLEGDDLDALFESGDIFSMVDMSAQIGTPTEIKIEVPDRDAEIDIDAGAYNTVFIKFKDGANHQEAIERIASALEENRMDARIVNWQDASGMLSQMAGIARVFLTGVVLFIFFVAIIIIMNTLSMAAMERTTEIGMMRAVGAQKNFIAKMFSAETFALSFMFGGAGILVGILLVFIIRAMQIPVTNDLAQFIFGGDIASPFIDFGTLLSIVIQLIIVTLLSLIYPVVLARKITPLDAVSRN